MSNQTTLLKYMQRWTFGLRTKIKYFAEGANIFAHDALIIAEHLLPTDNHFSSSIVDYKFYCVNGEPYCCGVFYDRCPQTHHTNSTFYDMQWKRQDEWKNPTIKTPSKDISRPYTFERMKQICKDLAKGFPFVRLDFYEANKHVYFGEFTFTPAALSGGSMNLELCNEIGRLIKLPSKTC